MSQRKESHEKLVVNVLKIAILTYKIKKSTYQVIALAIVFCPLKGGLVTEMLEH